MVDYPGLTISSPLFFNADESIDYETLDRYLADVCRNSEISAIYSMAYNTRYRMLDNSELLEVNAFIAKKVKSYGHNVYVGHPYTFSRASLMSYLEAIASYEPDGISMLYPERYYGIDQPIIDFLKTPSLCGLNTVVHEMKLVSGFNGELIDWPTALLERVMDEISPVAIKEDSKSDEITRTVITLCEKFNVHCVLAGGGKVRAEKFLNAGLRTWLNGSTMFLPALISRVYSAWINGDEIFKKGYLVNIEKPFFEKIVQRYGWHIAHKAALEFFGYGTRIERFPHPQMPDSTYKQCEPIFRDIKRFADSL